MSGRIVSRRTAGTKLVFYDLQDNGQTVQVVCSIHTLHALIFVRCYTNTDPKVLIAANFSETPLAFAALHQALRKGDIIQVSGAYSILVLFHSPFSTYASPKYAKPESSPNAPSIMIHLFTVVAHQP